MCLRVSKAETGLLLSLPAIIKRPDLKIYEWDSTEYYILNDGRLLLDFKDADYSLIFKTEKDYMALFKKSNSHEENYILKGFPSRPVQFINSITKSKLQIEKLLLIKNLNFSFQSLKKIDNAIVQNALSQNFYFKRIFRNLVPYVTHTIVKEQNAELIFMYNSKENVSEPHLRLVNGRIINVFIDLYEDALENFDDFSIYSTSRMRLDNL